MDRLNSHSFLSARLLTLWRIYFHNKKMKNTIWQNEVNGHDEGAKRGGQLGFNMKDMKGIEEEEEEEEQRYSSRIYLFLSAYRSISLNVHSYKKNNATLKSSSEEEGQEADIDEDDSIEEEDTPINSDDEDMLLAYAHYTQDWRDQQPMPSTFASADTIQEHIINPVESITIAPTTTYDDSDLEVMEEGKGARYFGTQSKCTYCREVGHLFRECTNQVI